MGSTKYAALLLEKLNGQARRCYYTGAELTPGEASVDHLMPVNRYPERRSDPSNVVWCLKNINLMKNGMTEAEFLHFCKVIAARHTDKENAQGAGVSPHQAAVGDELRIPRL